MANDTPTVNEFLTIANEFCGMIDRMDDHNPNQWLVLLGPLLLRLEAAISVLAEHPAAPTPLLGHPDLEKRFELYAHIKEFLRDLDEYWSEGDLQAEDGDKTGSLSEDLSDIYFEIMQGMSLIGTDADDRDAALNLWVSGYLSTWRQHLVDARKQLIDFGRGERRKRRRRQH